MSKSTRAPFFMICNKTRPRLMFLSAIMSAVSQKLAGLRSDQMSPSCSRATSFSGDEKVMGDVSFVSSRLFFSLVYFLFLFFYSIPRAQRKKFSGAWAFVGAFLFLVDNCLPTTLDLFFWCLTPSLFIAFPHGGQELVSSFCFFPIPFVRLTLYMGLSGIIS